MPEKDLEHVGDLIKDFEREDERLSWPLDGVYRRVSRGVNNPTRQEAQELRAEEPGYNENQRVGMHFLREREA